jgi:amino acid transporter
MADPGPPALDLRRVIGFWGGTALIIGLVIGSGIFRKPPTIAEQVPDPLVIMGLWIGFGVICLCGALTLAELSSMLPRTGGVYIYLRAAYGDAVAFVFGWINLLVTCPAGQAALAVVFGEFLLSLLGYRKEDAPAWFLPALAIWQIVVLALANIRGVRLGSAIQATLTVVKVLALAAMIAAVFALGKGDATHFVQRAPAPLTLAGVAAAAAAIIWTYDGWVNVSMVAGEIIGVERAMKRIMCWGMLAITALYLLANGAYLYLVPLERMPKYEAGIAAHVTSQVAGPIGGTLIGVCILASVFGANAANSLAKPRMPFAMARDGLLFRFVGRVHPRWETPYAAIAVQTAAGVAMVLWLKDFDALTDYFVVVEWFSLLFAVAAVFILRATMPDAPRPYRTPLYPIVPLVFLVGTAVGLGAIVWGKIVQKNYSPVIGLAIALVGFPIYWIWRRLAPAK